MAQGKETSVGIKLIADLRNYNKNLTEAQKQNKRFKQNVKSEMNQVNGAFRDLMNGDVKALPRFFKAATTSAGGFAKGLHGVKAALIATGLGAILVGIGLAVASITQYFKGTEEGQIVFKKVMNNVQAYVQPVLQMFGRFGKALVQLFSGEFGAAWETAKGAIAGVGDQIQANQETVKELNKVEGDYIANKRKWNREIKESQREISELILKTRDANVSNIEKQEALIKAQQLQEKINARRLDIANEELKIEELKGSLGDNTIEDNERIEELKDNILTLEKQGNDQLREIVNRQNELRPKLEAELALRDAILKRQQDAPALAEFKTIEKKQVDGNLNTGELDTGDLESMAEWLEENAKRTERFKTQLYELNDTQAAIVGSVAAGFELMANSMVSSLGLAATGFQGFLGTMLGLVTKMISMLLAESLANAIAGGAQAGKATGPLAIFTTPAFIATAIGTVFAAFAKIPKFNDGGIVPGSSFFGDKVLARLNSGEEVLRRDDPRHRNNLGGEISEGSGFVAKTAVEGDDLLILVERAEARRRKRIGQ